MNIDDADYSPDTKFPPKERNTLTDMTLSLRKYHALAFGKALGFPDELMAPGSTAHPRQQQQLVEDFEQIMRKLLRHCDPNASQYAWCTYHGTLTMTAGMRLLLYRPMSNNLRNAAHHPDPTHILKLAVAYLEREQEMRADPRAEPFYWISVIPAHPLAVAITECYSCDHVVLLRHVWPTVEKAFERIGTVIAENRQGTPWWRPLERLMVKTRPHVHALLEEGTYETGKSKGSQGNDRSPVVVSSTMYYLTPSAPASLEHQLRERPAQKQQNWPGVVSRQNSSNDFDLEFAPMRSPFPESPASSTPLLIDNASMQSSGSTPGQDWMMDIPATDLSILHQMAGSLQDPGWAAWDEFINELALDDAGRVKTIK